MDSRGAGWEGEESLEEIDVESQGEDEVKQERVDEYSAEEPLNRSISGNE